MKTRTNRFWLIAVAAVTMMTVACNSDDSEEVINEPNTNEEPAEPTIVEPKTRVDIVLSLEVSKVNDAANQFSLNFFDQMLKHVEASSNIVVSPFYAQAALAMMANGAKGETLDEILAVLNMKGFSLDEINSYNQTVIKAIADLDNTTYPMSANGVWSKQDSL